LFVYLNTGNGFDSGKQWQSNLGGDENWKNRTTYKNGEHSKLIDLNGDGLPDRVFDHNPEADDQPGFFVYLNTGALFAIIKAIACIKIDKQPCLVSLWVSVEDSIR
jgi:hypothetical protein